MSFPKAKLKRFNDIAVFSSPFGGKSSSSKKDKKSQKTGSASDLDAVKSESKSSKSTAYRLFRTPSLPRRLKFRANSESTPKKTPTSAKGNDAGIPLPAAIRQKEAVEIIRQELKHKTEKLSEYEELFGALRAKYDDAVEENVGLRGCLDGLRREAREADRATKLLRQVADGALQKIMEFEIERAMLVRDYEGFVKELQAENERIREERAEKQEFVEFLQVETEVLRVCAEQSETRIRQLTDDGIALRRERSAHEEERQKMLTEMKHLQKVVDDLTVELELAKDMNAEVNQELRECQIELDHMDLRLKETESVAVLERAKLLKCHVEHLAEVEKDKIRDIEKINETAEERIRLAALQADEKTRSLEREIEAAVERETAMWRSELDRCQKIAENEILQIEYEKRDLKVLLDDANELMKEKDRQIVELDRNLKTGDDIYTRSRRDCEGEMKKMQEAYQKLLTEKHSYQLTLENTRSTVSILMERLKRSDTDVEVLNLEKSSMNCEIERLKEQILRLEDEKEELRGALEALTKSSVALEVEMKGREALFEQLMNSEAETLAVVDNLGKLFQDRLDEGAGRYAEMYNDLKKRYEVRETYIKDMKALLEEFADGIELARIELDLKDQKLNDLEEENRNIKLESMTYKFKCQQFESEGCSKTDGARPPNPTPDPTREAPEGVESNQMIQELIDELEKETDDAVQTETVRQIHLLEDFVDWNTDHAEENRKLRQQLQEMTRKVEKLEAQMQENAAPKDIQPVEK
uniref:Uncharacterized protein n=1 Tax=Lutzomyia longipalpis TaxID=7200 RepID=A0A1B0CJY9_LUTLO